MSTPRNRYYSVKDGEWVQPIRKGYKLACCDCALTHTMDFRIHKGRVQFRADRDNRATANKRRGYKGIKFHHEFPAER